MSIKKSAISQKQKDLEDLRWKFKEFILNNQLVKDLPTMVNNQIYTLSHNLEQCSFSHDKFTLLEGQVISEEYVKQLIINTTKIDN